MNYTQNQKIEQVTESTLVLGVDIGSSEHYVRAFDYLGRELTRKVFRFSTDINGFNSFYDWVTQICIKHGKNEAMIGCEPTGHYWYTFYQFVKDHGMKLAFVNPASVKKAKELDDNSPKKTDLKDPKTIAKLVIDGRYSFPYVPEGIYAEIREVASSRDRIMKELNAASNRIQRWLKIYFPEYLTVYKKFDTTTGMMILEEVPLPTMVTALGVDNIVKIWREHKERGVSGQQVQQPLQVGGHQNVHAGRGGLEELPLCGVSTGGEEIGQHVVLVGCADQLAHGQTHLLGVVARQNVTEVAGGDGVVHHVAQPDAAGLHQIAVGAEVIDHLGGQTADIDGVGRGEHGAVEVLVLAGGEDLLHAGLGVVEVAADGADADVGTLLGGHLGLLNGGDAAVGVEHGDAGAGHVVEALHGRLAGVAGGGGEDQDILFHPLDGFGGGEQLGQHGKRHVLKGGRRPPEQLQHGVAAYGNGGGQVFRFKFPLIGAANQRIHIGNIRQQGGKNFRGHFRRAALQAGQPVKRGNLLGHIQTAVGGKTLQHGFGAVHKMGFAPGRMIEHNILL